MNNENLIRVTRDEIVRGLAAKAEKFETKAAEFAKRAETISDPVDTRFGAETPTGLRMRAEKCRNVAKDCRWIEQHLVERETFELQPHDAQIFGLITQGFSCGDPDSSLF